MDEVGADRTVDFGGCAKAWERLLEEAVEGKGRWWLLLRMEDLEW